MVKIKRHQLLEANYNTLTTTTLVYDTLPVIDYFKYVDNDTVISLAHNKEKGGVFFFYLTRHWS
jgi:hypothetical protein